MLFSYTHFIMEYWAKGLRTKIEFLPDVRVCTYNSIIRKLMQEGYEFKASLDYKLRLCLTMPKKRVFCSLDFITMM
jgi:hypothetical protein